MATYSGKDGAFSYGGSDYPCTAWSVTQTAQVADTTDSSSTTWKDFTASGFHGWTFTVEGFLKSGAATPAIGASAALVFTLDTGQSYSGSGIITSKGVTTNIDGTEAVKVSLSGQGTGAITEDVTA